MTLDTLHLKDTGSWSYTTLDTAFEIPMEPGCEEVGLSYTVCGALGGVQDHRGVCEFPTSLEIWFLHLAATLCFLCSCIIMLLRVVGFLSGTAVALNDGMDKLPKLRYDTSNVFGCDCNFTLVMNQIQAMKDKGLCGARIQLYDPR